MDLHQQTSSNSSLKAKFKQCLCFSCSSSSPSTKIQSEENCNPPSNHSSIWIRTKEHEVRAKCVNAINRIGHHRRYSSTDFRYDPSSYALNFQDGDDDYLIDEESRLRNFSSRLPASPAKVSREIRALN